jgi:peptidoglycan/LPS O-acetylase OafA/YrhL
VFAIAVPALYTGGVSADAYHAYAMTPLILDVAADSMMWSFAAGVAIGLVYHARFAIRRLAVANALAAVAVAVVVWQQLSGADAGYGLTGWAPAMIAMVLALALRDKLAPVHVPRVLIWLGDVSFSLYLVHRIAQAGLLRVLPAGVNGVVYLVVSTAGALALAQLSYRYLELGLCEWLRRRVLG